MPAEERGTSKDPVPHPKEPAKPYDWTNLDLWMLTRVRASLQARLEGRNEGGDTEVMRLVDEIVKKATKDLLALVPKPRRSHIDMLSDDPFSHKDH